MNISKQVCTNFCSLYLITKQIGLHCHKINKCKGFFLYIIDILLLNIVFHPWRRRLS